MRSPFGWGLVAIWTQSNTGLALVAAATAIVAASLLFVEVGMRGWNPPVRTTHPSGPGPSDKVRAAFASGRLGRESMVALLDRLSRTTSDPTHPSTSLEQLETIVRMSPEDFRAYVRARVEYLEARS